MLNFGFALFVKSTACSIIHRNLQKMATTTMEPTTKYFKEIVKSELDKRSYKGILLANGLRALVVSDPTTDKAAASLDVHTGSMCDPDNVPGLAHFCEHMLFLGTDKYPEEDEYQKYISQHAGSCNAYTSSEHTNYHFDIGHEHLHGALDRFSQFFICPKFDQSCTDREINAVNSEHLKNIMSDARRLHRVDLETSDPTHPFCKFGTGNSETLCEIPKKNGIDIRNELINFHSKNYSSNIMGLVVIGRESIDVLTSWVESMFFAVKNKNIQVQCFDKTPYREVDLGKKYYVTPVKDMRNLLLTFPIQDLTQLYSSCPASYLAHLIGHEGPGSLLSLLKSKGWVNSLCAGPKGGANGFDFFIIQVDLTNEGQNHVDDIISCMFQYIKLLKQDKPLKWIHDEMKEVLSINFTFKDKEKPTYLATKLSGNLHKYPMEKILSANSILTDFKPEKIMEILNCLVPQNMKIVIINKECNHEKQLNEKWYDTQYSIEVVDKSLLTDWQNVPLCDELKIPSTNDFIATNLEVKEKPLVPTRVPKLLQKNEFSTVWFKQDHTFNLPKQTMTFKFYSPLAYVDPHHTNMLFMFIELLEDSLNEYSYDAELAGLHYTIKQDLYGMFLRIKGYNHKQHILLEKILRKLTDFQISSSRFNLLKDVYARSLDNFKAEQPYQHAAYYSQVLRCERIWTKEELKSALDELTLDNLNNFLPTFLKHLNVESLFHGNINERECLQLTELVESIMKKKNLLPSQLYKYRDICLPAKSAHVFNHHNTVQNTNAIQLYLQVGPQNVKENITMELLQQIISEPFFNILRTKEQLGYITHSGPVRSNGVQGMRFIIQSERDPMYLEARTEAFINHIGFLITEMDENEFNRHKDALKSKRLEKPKKLVEESVRHWSEISCGQYMFERDAIETDLLKNVSREELLAFYNKVIHHKGEKRAKLSVHVYCKDQTVPSKCTFDIPKHNQELNTEFLKCPDIQDSLIIDNPNLFRMQLPLHGRVKPYMNF